MSHQLNPYYEVPFRSGDVVNVFYSKDVNDCEVFTFDEANALGLIVRDDDDASDIKFALIPWTAIHMVVSA